MHGYFLSLKLYDTARIIANPFAYDEHREKLVREKLEKEAESRIRAKKQPGVKVNKALAEKILREEEKAKLRAEKKNARRPATGDMDVDAKAEKESARPNILSDPRFAKVFEDPAFTIDEASREYALLNPSSFAQRGNTAVEEEEEESDKVPSDGSGGSSSESEGEVSDVDSDSSAEGGTSFIVRRSLLRARLMLTVPRTLELTKFDPRSNPGQRNFRAEEAYAREKAEKRKLWTSKKVSMVPLRAQAGGASHSAGDRGATFGERRAPGASSRKSGGSKQARTEDAPMEISWVPSGSAGKAGDDGEGKAKAKAPRRKGVESFGAGLERGVEETVNADDAERQGRTQRRKGVRSGSKNVFRQMDR